MGAKDISSTQRIAEQVRIHREEFITSENASFGSDALNQMFGHWMSLHGGDELPLATALDPLNFMRYLPHIMLFSVERGGERLRYKIRLNGEEQIAIVGRNMVGRYLEEIDDEMQGYDSIHERYNEVVEKRQAHYWKRSFIDKTKEWRTYERILLPFISKTGEVVRIVGVAAALS